VRISRQHLTQFVQSSKFCRHPGRTLSGRDRNRKGTLLIQKPGKEPWIELPEKGLKQ
jgi:hypothetical protein